MDETIQFLTRELGEIEKQMDTLERRAAALRKSIRTIQKATGTPSVSLEGMPDLLSGESGLLRKPDGRVVKSEETRRRMSTAARERWAKIREDAKKARLMEAGQGKVSDADG
jgi:hypothetical protein